MIYAFENYLLDTDRRELHRGTDRLAVEPGVFDLLQYMICNRERVVSKDDLIAAVWNGRIVSESTISARINAVRSALGDTGEQQRLLRTLPRKGFRFVSEVWEKQQPSNGSAASPEAPRNERQSPVAVHSRGPERRQLTIMVCNMLGLTDLSARLDPEDLREVMATYHDCVREVVDRHGGFVAKDLADGTLAYFGYPKAHEDDAERAVRAGLAAAKAIGALRLEGLANRLQARVGIATGLVVVGDVINDRPTEEHALVGEPPLLAARLLTLAPPGAVVMSAGTRRLVGRLFECRDLSPVKLKGIAEPVDASQVLGEGAIPSRYEALHGLETSPLVGREEELDLLMRRWEVAKSGKGRVVLLTGEAGIGKSRLTWALKDRLTAHTYTPLIFHCSPYHQDSALHPIITQLVRASGIEQDDNTEAKLSKLEALLAQSSETLPDDMALFAALLSISGGERYPLPNLVSQQIKQRTLDALLDHFRRRCAARPVLLVFEDLHWIDPTSLELLSLMVEQTSDLPCLLLATARPGFTPPWPTHQHVSIIALARLGRSDVETLVESVTRGKVLPSEVLAQIVSRTDGVPLFIEELTKTVLESGILREAGDRYELTGPLPPRSIPSTLHASLLARLDGLATAKDVAQIGAVIGGRFSYSLIAAVSALPEEDLKAALAQLVAAELIFQRGVPPNATYLFKHTLVQDAAYASLLHRRRQQLHGQIAHVLEEQVPSLAPTAPETLAHHYAEAGTLDKAISYWSKAGRISLDRSAMLEATVQLGRALSLLAELPEGVQRNKQELTLQTGLGVALTATKGYAAPATGQAYARARRLCEELGDTVALVRVGYGEYLYHLMRGEARQSHQVASEILSLAETIDDDDARILGHRTLGVSLFEFGQLAAARSELETAAKLLQLREQKEQGRRGREAEIMISTWLAYVLAYQGYLDQALRTREASLAQANASRALHWRSFAMGFAGGLSMLLQEYADLLKRGNALVAFTNEHNFLQHESTGLLYRGYAQMFLGDANAVPLVREGLAIYRETGAKWALPCFLGTFADALRRHGNDAMPVLREAFAAVEATEERWYEAELYRLRGDHAIFGSCRDEHRAEQDYWAAKRIAEQQGSKLLELRATSSLAKLWHDQGRHTEAHDLLAPVYAWFTEGLDTPDLKHAEALLIQ